MTQDEKIDIFAERLFKAREDRHLTQQELADKLHITRQCLSRYENGEREVKASVLLDIANILNVSTDYLLGRTDCKTTDTDKAGAAEYLGLSEKSVENIRNVTEKYEHFNFLFESDRFEKIIELLDAIKDASVDYQVFTNTIVDNEEEFCRNYPLNNEEFIGDEIYSDTELVIKDIRRLITDIVRLRTRTVIFYFSEAPEDFSETIDLYAYKVNTELVALVEEIKLDTGGIKQISKDVNDQTIDLIKNLAEAIDEELNKSGLNNEQRRELEFKHKALSTFLTKYGPKLKIIKDGDE